MAKIDHKPVLTGLSLFGFLAVVVAHAAVLYGMWHHRFSTTTPDTVMLYAQFIAPPEQQAEIVEAPKTELKVEHTPPKIKPTPPPIKKQPKPKHQLVAKAPAAVPQEAVAPLPPVEEHKPEPEPEPEKQVVKETETVAAAKPAQMPSGPVTLSSELSVSCPDLRSPSYPALSRRLGEEGKLMLRVELDESGHISQASVVESSGYSRLDNAALSVVKTWRCRPAIRDGRAVPSVALQPFNFVIEGS